MKHLIIVGAGGMGRSMYLHAQNCIGYGTIFDVKGFLEIDKNMLDNFEGGKSSVSCPLKPSDSAPLKHSTMPP